MPDIDNCILLRLNRIRRKSHLVVLEGFILDIDSEVFKEIRIIKHDLGCNRVHHRPVPTSGMSLNIIIMSE